jgi:predicted Zn-dependent peptidase
MKEKLLTALILSIMTIPATAQKTITKTSPDQKYTYTTVLGDPLAVRYYTLANGLTVILSVNKAEPRIQTFIPVRAGSKNDPADHTGLAHYLEHMMFKGTDKYGTMDYATEKIYLDQIDQLYEDYNHTTDETKRAEIYKKIDSVSGIAAKYAIANEYDKMATALGATGTNAFTSVEETVYINNIPSNQLENWLILEAERFRCPVFRIFHTELEAVYEEKNRGLDNDDVKVDEALMSGLFQHHPYGTQTTIGTIEHLKNPSLEKIKEYYNTYYVPNNMAVIMAGDFDPDTAIALVDKHFSKMEPKTLPVFAFQPETEATAPIIKNVTGPKSEEVDIAFRFPGAGTRESMMLRITNSLLFNNKAGLIDINLVKSQKLLDAGTYQSAYRDYSYQVIQGEPATGQKLEEVKDLLIGEIEKIKKGQFDEGLIQAIVNNMKLDEINKQENNGSRAYILMDAFATGRAWADVLQENEDLKKVTKAEIVAFANKWYKNDYVVVYKRIGEDKSIVKVPKPPITQVVINRDNISPFADMIVHASAKPLTPVFLDYKTAIKKANLNHDVPLYYLKNTENERFTMYYFLDMGKDNDTKLPLASNYLQLLGTDKYTADQVSEAFYRLAANFGVSAGYDRTYMYLSGLQENFDATLELFEHLLHNAKPDQKALDALISNTLQERENQKMDKNVILNRGMVFYAKYGARNSFNNNISTANLKKLKADDMAAYLKNLTGYKHKVYYYGPASIDDVVSIMNIKHQTPAELRPYPAAADFEAQSNTESKVYFTNYDMVQANIYWVATSGPYSVEALPATSLFNEYFGGGMGSIVFQTLRESKALAYSTTSRYETPNRRTDPFFTTAFIGTQADKLNEAITGMNDLLQHMPVSDILLENARRGLKGQIEAQRIIRNDILMNYDQAMRMGNDHDVRKDVYDNLEKLTMRDVEKFHKDNYETKKYSYCILASKDKINMADLEKYGKVEELSLEQIFGY